MEGGGGACLGDDILPLDKPLPPTPVPVPVIVPAPAPAPPPAPIPPPFSAVVVGIIIAGGLDKKPVSVRVVLETAAATGVVVAVVVVVVVGGGGGVVAVDDDVDVVVVIAVAGVDDAVVADVVVVVDGVGRDGDIIKGVKAGEVVEPGGAVRVWLALVSWRNGTEPSPWTSSNDGDDDDDDGDNGDS